MAGRVPLATLPAGSALVAVAGELETPTGAISAASAYVYTHGTTSQVTVNAAETGGSTLAQPIAADVDGQLPGWTASLVPIDVAWTVVTPAGIFTKTIPGNPVYAADAGGTGGGGMANPMTAVGDLIVGGAVSAGVATPTRQAIGANGTRLGVVGGAVQWVVPAINPTVQIKPSGSAATDDANFAAACTALNGTGGAPAGGEIQLVGDFNNPFLTANTAGTYTGNGWAPPATTVTTPNTYGDIGGPVCVKGIGSPMLMPVGAAKTGFYYHGASVSGANDMVKGGYIRDVIVDGSQATGASVGWDVGDVIGGHFYGSARHFNTSGAVGLKQWNRTYFTEKCTFDIETFDCDTAVQIGGGINSHEYNVYDLVVHATGLDGSGNSLNQTGVVITGGVGRCRLYIRGNMIPTTSTSAGNPTGNAALLAILGASSGSMWRCNIVIGAEINSYTGTGTVKPFSVYQDGSGGVMTNCSGHVNIADGFTTWSANGDEHSFNGPVTYSQQPNWPPSGNFTAITNAAGVTNKNPTGLTSGAATWYNAGLPCFVRVSGSGPTDVQIDGQSYGGSSPPWYALIPPGSTLKIPSSAAASTNVSFMRAIGGG